MPPVDGLEPWVGGVGSVRALQGVVRVQPQRASLAEVVQRARSGQPRQRAPKITARAALQTQIASPEGTSIMRPM